MNSVDYAEVMQYVTSVLFIGNVSFSGSCILAFLHKMLTSCILRQSSVTVTLAAVG